MALQRFIVYPKVNICISETFVTLVYSQLILGSLFTVPERSTVSAVIHCLNALFCFILCTRRECGAPNGSTAFLLTAFVLEGFLTSQPKNTQALLLPQGKIRTGNSLIERKPSCTPSRWAQHGMFDHSEKKKGLNPELPPFEFFASSSAALRRVVRGRIRAQVQREGGWGLRFVHHQVCPDTGMLCVRRYIFARQVEVLASCLVKALIMAAAKSNHQGQQS